MPSWVCCKLSFGFGLFCRGCWRLKNVLEPVLGAHRHSVFSFVVFILFVQNALNDGVIGPDWRCEIFKWLLNGRFFWSFLAWGFDIRSGFFVLGGLFAHLLLEVLTIFSFIFLLFGFRIAGLWSVSYQRRIFLDWLLFVDLLHFL